MRYTFVLLALVICWTATIQAQLPMPRDIARAYKKETRQPDGRPGENYWQNHSRYDISIKTRPPDRNITGVETIVYTNNSPDTMRYLVFKLFLNIHKPGAPRDFGAGPEYLTSGVHIDRIAVNGKPVKFRDDPYVFTQLPLGLPRALPPHDSVQIAFDWHYEISLQSNREGMIDSTTYFLAYFYPRIAVRDDYNGWDRMDFTDGKEFYSDFNDYTVSIEVPKNYIVWGTGTLQQPEQLLQPTFAKRFQESLTTDKILHIATKAELDAHSVTTQNATNIWQFKANNVPDMAFGLSDHFVWDASSVVVDDATQRRASVQAVYCDTAADYRRMVEYGRHSLNWLSHNWPGIAYPYEKMTVFQGFAGMEYPMMANDETYQDTTFSRFVAEHEIAHTYMPFYMGINETRYGFMDEGWATTFELLIGREDLGVEKAEANYKEFRVDGWIHDPSAEQDVPIITPGNMLNGPGLGNNQYGKASLGYLAVKDMLGDVLFKKCLHAYMDRWHGKHPTPWDFFYTFNDVSGKDLNWFWQNWFFTSGYIDLSVKNVQKVKKGYDLTIDNTGGFAAPVDVQITYTDGTLETLHQTPECWQNNQKQAVITVKTSKTIQSVNLTGGIFMDANERDNRWKM